MFVGEYLIVVGFIDVSRFLFRFLRVVIGDLGWILLISRIFKLFGEVILCEWRLFVQFIWNVIVLYNYFVLPNY